MGFKIKDLTAKSRGIDEVTLLSWGDRFLLFVEQNRNIVLAGLCLTLVAAGILGGVIWMEYQHGKDALALEGQAQSYYVDRAVEDPDKAKENLGKAIELYRQIIDEYPRTASAGLAWFYLGNALVEQEDLKGAIEAYETFVDRHQGDELKQGLGFQRLGYAYLEEGNPDKAFQAFSKILTLPSALNKDQILFESAKLQEADGKTDNALTHYKNLVEQFPDSPYTSEASLRVKALATEEDEPKQQDNAEQESLVEPNKESDAEAKNPSDQTGAQTEE